MFDYKDRGIKPKATGITSLGFEIFCQLLTEIVVLVQHLDKVSCKCYKLLVTLNRILSEDVDTDKWNRMSLEIKPS